MLFVDDILHTGAYLKSAPPEGNDIMTRANGTQVPKQYVAWFNPGFEFVRTEIDGTPFMYRHMDPDDPSLETVIDDLVRNIRSRGLRNPALITKREQIWVLHPGKCRAEALKRLGIRTIPAIFVDHTPGATVPDGFYEIRSQKQLQKHFEGDVAVEMTHRGIRTPKLR